MKRKIISALLALIICFSLVFTVSANDVTFVVDEVGYLAGGEIELLNKQAAAIYAECNVGIFFVYTTAEDLASYDITPLVGSMEDYYVMIENDEKWGSFLGGIAEDYLDPDTEDVLRGIYDEADTYFSGVSDYMDAAAECFPYIADTAEGDVSKAGEYFVYDDADLLNDSEEAALEQKLMDISGTYNVQLVVCTIESMDGGVIDRFDDYLYDTMGFGYGENHDGAMLLVCMNPRQYRILCNGFADKAIDNDAISDDIVSNLSDGNYAVAFNDFADQCAYYLDGQQNGFPFKTGKNLVIALVIGIAAGLIVSFVLKGQLKTVRKQDKANVYVKPGSMNVTVRSDIFLYRNVTRTQKSSSGSSSGGGSSRSSSGGSF